MRSISVWAPKLIVLLRGIDPQCEVTISTDVAEVKRSLRPSDEAKRAQIEAAVDEFFKQEATQRWW